MSNEHFKLFPYYIQVEYWDFQPYKLTFALFKDKIYCTIGPSSEKYPTIDTCVKAFGLHVSWVLMHKEKHFSKAL